MARKAQEITEKTGNPDASKNILDAMLRGYQDTHFNHLSPKQVRIPSGSLKMDSYIQAKSGTIIRMGGPQGAGKSSQSFLFAKNYLETMPKSKAVYIDTEFKLSEELQKRTGLKFVSSGSDWDYGTVFVLKSNVAETIGDMLVSMLKTAHQQEEHLVIILDSVDMLISERDIDKKSGESKMPAGINKLTKDLFRKICPMIQSYNALLIMITQYAAVFNPDPYSKTAPQMMDGNNTHALNHQCSLALYYRMRNNGDYILEKQKEKPDPLDNKILGENAKVEIKKTPNDNKGYTIEIPIRKGRVGNCVWQEKEVGDMVMAYELAKGSQWITFGPDIVQEAKTEGLEIKEKVNGINALYNYLEEDSKVCQWLANKVKSITELRMQLVGENG